MLFLFFIVVLSNFLMIPAVIEKIKVKHAVAIPAGTPIVLANETIDILLLFALKTINILSMKSKTVTYLINLLLYDSLPLISLIK